MISVVSQEISNAIIRANENLRCAIHMAVVFFLAGCDAGPDIIKISGEQLGTQYRVTVVADQPAPDDLSDQIAALIGWCISSFFKGSSDHAERGQVAPVFIGYM